MNEVRMGHAIVVGHAGVRVSPEERSPARQMFEFMNSPVSTEKPKGAAIRQIARELCRKPAAGGKTLLVGGPAIVHTGSGEYVCRLIRDGYVDVLFAGNALATHDIEQAMFGTSLGVYLERGEPGRGGARTSPAGDQPHPPRGRHPPGGRKRPAHLRHHVRVRAPKGRFRAGRQHPRRRPAARRDHRRPGRPAADAREDSAA